MGGGVVARRMDCCERGVVAGRVQINIEFYACP